MKRMTSWGAILLGSTLIAGIYGMNFDHMPELSWSFGYPAAIGSMLVLTIVLYTWFKRRDRLSTDPACTAAAGPRPRRRDTSQPPASTATPPNPMSSVSQITSRGSRRS